MNKPSIQTLYVGKVEPLADTPYFSAINKQRVDTPEKVTELGFLNDEQQDKIHHGGVDKAIHQYPYEHYEYWKDQLPNNEILNNGGAFGENLLTLGMTEETVCIGDRYRVGTCVIEVSQARQPCWKLNYRFGYPKMSEQVQNTLKTGWYYRVIETGVIQQNNTFELLERPYPQYTLYTILSALYKENKLSPLLLKELTRIEPLADSWKKVFDYRLETGSIEPWERRLYK